jgi:hypothetical protein
MNRYLSSTLFIQQSRLLAWTSAKSSSSVVVTGTVYGPGTSPRKAVKSSLASPSSLASSFLTVQTRLKHSSTQIKRLFKKNPARRRIELREQQRQQQQQQQEEVGISRIPQAKYAPVLSESVRILPNGWTPPPPASVTIPGYPFKVARTGNKPNQAVGFLPVYSEFR